MNTVQTKRSGIRLNLDAGFAAAYDPVDYKKAQIRSPRLLHPSRRYGSSEDLIVPNPVKEKTGGIAVRRREPQYDVTFQGFGRLPSVAVPVAGFSGIIDDLKDIGRDVWKKIKSDAFDEALSGVYNKLATALGISTAQLSQAAAQDPAGFRALLSEMKAKNEADKTRNTMLMVGGGAAALMLLMFAMKRK